MSNPFLRDLEQEIYDRRRQRSEKPKSYNLQEMIDQEITDTLSRELPEQQERMYEGEKNALELEWDRLQKGGPKPFFGIMDLPDLIDQELATQMITPTGTVSRKVQEYGLANGWDPYEMYQKATGEKWRSETELRQMVERGMIGDRERQNIVRNQSSMADNASRMWEELMLVFSDVLPAAASGIGEVIDHTLEGDTKALKEDAAMAAKLGELFAVELGADALALVSRPLEYMRESPLDAAAWVTPGVGTTAKAIGTGKAALKAAKAGENVSDAAKLYWKNTNSGDIIRGVGQTIVDKTPIPASIKRTFIDLYAGTSQPFKELRKRYLRRKDADSAILEEFVLAPLHKMAKRKDVTPEMMSQMFTALVSTLETVPLRKKAVALAQLPSTPINKLKLKGARVGIDQAQPKYVSWTYDGIPMSTSEFLFDLKPAKWDSSKIGYEFMPDAPKAVKDNIDRLLDVKKTLFEIGADQASIRTSSKMPKVATAARAVAPVVDNIVEELVPVSVYKSELPSGARIPVENGKIKPIYDPKKAEEMGYAPYIKGCVS